MALAAATCAAAACTTESDDSAGDGNGDAAGVPGDGDGDSGSTGGSAMGMDDIVVGETGGTDGMGGERMDRPEAELIETLPDGFVVGIPGVGTVTGGYSVLGPLEEFDEPTDNVCKNVLRAVIRDFNQSHIDFGQEKPATWGTDPTPLPGLYQGHVNALLGDNRKPTINPARMPLDVIEAFDDWYVNLEGVNAPYVMDIWLEPDPENEGTFVFDTTQYFPLDEYVPDPSELQFGIGGSRNFGFTTELHTAFAYRGGEVFNFRGDDDVFVFINGHLAVDLGGIHDAYEGNVILDDVAAEFGLQVGQVYDLDLFQAERNPGASNFRIETSLDFQECGILPVDLVR